MTKLRNEIIVYGANGYSAQLIIEQLIKIGYKPVLAGRNEKLVNNVAARFNCNYKIFDLGDTAIIKAAIYKFDFLLNCAGPFKYTAPQLIDACIESGTNYLDITGEIPVIEYAWSKNEEAKSAGIVISPSIGFDVIPTDCLSKNLFNLLPDASSLELGLLNKNGKISRGTWLTTLEMFTDLGKVRRDGNIIDSEPGEFTYSINKPDFHFNGISIPWGDIASAYYSTGIKNITVYLGISKQLLKFKGFTKYAKPIISSKIIGNYISDAIKENITGPNTEQRNRTETFVWGKVKNKNGEFVEKCYQVMEGYNTTQKGAADILHRLITTELLPGTKTPSMIMGEDYFDEFVLRTIF